MSNIYLKMDLNWGQGHLLSERVLPFEEIVKALDVGVDDGCEIEGHHLGEEESADDDNAETLATLSSGSADSECNGEGAHKRCEGGHEDGAAADEKSMGDRLVDGSVLGVARGVGKINENDAVFHHNAEQHDESHDCIKREGLLADDEAEKTSER